jgi:hypothetical protein
MLKQMTARFSSKCAETGKPLNKGDQIIYDPIARKAYHLESQKAGECEAPDNDALLVAAQTNALYDQFCQTNNI